MTATIYQFRAFESVRAEATGMGDRIYRDAVRKVIREQQEGRSGKNVAWELSEFRRQNKAALTPPFGGWPA